MHILRAGLEQIKTSHHVLSGKPGNMEKKQLSISKRLQVEFFLIFFWGH